MESPFTDGVHEGYGARCFAAIFPACRFLEKKSETCAPVSEEAKRPSCPAKYRYQQYRRPTGLLQGAATDRRRYRQAPHPTGSETLRNFLDDRHDGASTWRRVGRV